jgi:hypothetical protein
MPRELPGVGAIGSDDRPESNAGENSMDMAQTPFPVAATTVEYPLNRHAP